ncbi:TPA: DUF4145 domain-containing protein [Yersinia enterocolitica]|uniref:DUF4145 domain-containing protein n=1 Tax=Yersinia enterocolitica TaxID=630 RepID=UPI000683363D|nr:DUF4145 domain-containing protein [Yersinia enterocolitica]EKN5995693.1 DUF4145 domain-containing protein [Yersinia enterocolitica]HEA9923400.1 DUF4145 domain-containing protein [Yersinia enterocolitica]HEN3337577.1 DUF4145 domain-containing protein [Yersinia enterocolitica]
MGILTLDITCPHCLREKAVLTAFGQVLKTKNEYCVSFLCRSCGNPISANVISVYTENPMEYVRQNSDDSIPHSQRFRLLDYFPQAATHVAPDNCPERASKFFVEAKENLHRGNYETSVMLCRKVIDIATREILGEESNKEQLSQRISMLHGKGKITEQMKDWAHIVRIDSNGAVHSDEIFTKDEAEEMIGFTEVFLIYSFTLPEMVNAKQKSSLA